MLVMILHAILMWQQGQQSQPVIAGDFDCIGSGSLPAHCWKPDVKVIPTLSTTVNFEVGDCLMVGSSGSAAKIPCGCGGDPSRAGGGGTVIGEYHPVPPFDVLPVETRSEEERCEFEVADGAWHQCMGGKKLTEVHISRVCADKSRFLLMSEDGRWHCLALGQKP